jgi:CheY-like chemotaxis protein
VCLGGHSAVKFIADHGADVDTVLTDVAMPDIDGLHVAAAAKEKWPTTRVVYMSGSREGTARLPCEDLFLPKPFNREQLLTAVLPFGIDSDSVQRQCAMP